MNNFIKKIKNNLPTKNNNKYDKYDKYNTYKIIIGKNINNNFFNHNINNVNYSKIFTYLNEQTWDNIMQYDVKHYYYNDLQFIITLDGHHYCKKEKLFSYSDFNLDNKDLNLRFMLLRYCQINPINFPPITEYHDIRKITKTRFIRNNINIELLLINNHDKSISYEMNIFTSKNNLNNLLEELYYIFKNMYNNFSINFINNKFIQNSTNNYSLSILL